MNRLVLDIGNTAVKWRCRLDDGVVQGGDMHGRDWLRVVNAIAGDCGTPDSVWVASVAGREADLELGDLLHGKFGVTPSFYYSAAEEQGVINAYPDPRRLGVDRWIAMVETWNRCGASIVVDCGSALTLDAVDAGGRHLGGYIVPGLEMLRASLATGTAEVQVSEEPDRAVAPGCSTSEGVRHGILLMTVSFIRGAVVELRQAVSDTCKVFITGGDARRIAPLLDFPVEMAPDLVLDGLERVMTRRMQGDGRT